MAFNPFENVPTDEDVMEAIETIRMMSEKESLTHELMSKIPWGIPEKDLKPVENICRNMIAYTISVYGALPVLRKVSEEHNVDLDNFIKAMEIQKECLNGILGIMGIQTIKKGE